MIKIIKIIKSNKTINKKRKLVVIKKKTLMIIITKNIMLLYSFLVSLHFSNDTAKATIEIPRQSPVSCNSNELPSCRRMMQKQSSRGVL